MDTSLKTQLSVILVSAAATVVTGYGTGYIPSGISGGYQEPGAYSDGYPSVNAQYQSPPCSQYYHDQYPSCNSQPRYGTTNCTTVLDNMYTIEYKEECGRKYDKICYGPHNTDCKAVVDPACYQVPTLSPVQVPREICSNPSTGEKCDNYSAQLSDSYPVRC